MSKRILKNWFLPLLILLAFVGGRAADAWDLSDYHGDLKKSHLERLDDSAFVADDSKHKLQAYVSFAPEVWQFRFAPAAPAPREAVQFTCSSVASPAAQPARAPPA